MHQASEVSVSGPLCFSTENKTLCMMCIVVFQQSTLAKHYYTATAEIRSSHGSVMSD
jgi:hypothetical protein